MGNEVLKQLQKEVSLEKVEKLMDQTREGIAYQQVSYLSSYHQNVADGNRKSTRHSCRRCPPRKRMRYKQNWKPSKGKL